MGAALPRDRMMSRMSPWCRDWKRSLARADELTQPSREHGALPSRAQHRRHHMDAAPSPFLARLVEIRLETLHHLPSYHLPSADQGARRTEAVADIPARLRELQARR